MHPPQVAVLGSGFAGLEAAFRLRQELGDEIKLVVVAETDDFLFRPDIIYLPFGGAAAKLRVPLGKAMRRRDIAHYIAEVERVDPDKGTVHTDRGDTINYDHLVIATGASMRPDEVPGMAEHARQIWTPSQMHGLGDDLQRLVQRVRHGQRQRVLFVVPPNNKCAASLYEIAFMLETWLRRREVRGDVDITFATYEPSFIQAFGPKLHDIVGDQFASREIDAHTNATVTKVNEREAVFTDGGVRPFDLMVTFPPHVPAVDYPGLPTDDRGFLHCHKASRSLVGHDEIYAAGDAGDFPVKLADLALLQADAAALDITGAVRRRPPAGGFEPICVYVLEMFDSATFVQVPLRATGAPAASVTVDQTAVAPYRVGTSVAWRTSKKVVGTYLPMRFRQGLPFRAGAPGRLMGLGLRAAAATLSR
jgi:sulfide:quinone oxidoreductase